MPSFRTGLDFWVENDFRALRGQKVGVLCHQASVDRHYRHILDHLWPLHHEGALRLVALFGPQHGLTGTTQDNMIEWEGTPQSEVRLHSLYGEVRRPTPEMLQGIDVLLIDLVDVGSRYYTFIWTMAMMLEECARHGIRVVVFDRPNPIGNRVEGTVQQPGTSSFVGYRPLPMRHGLTIGQIARGHVVAEKLDLDLLVIASQSYEASRYADELDLAWVLPSPNMPTVETAVVYPGGCLLEATNLSEGRGTTRPFELVGAPFLDGTRLAEALNAKGLPGAVFRAAEFEPTFNKHRGRICSGVQIHVVNRAQFQPVLTTIALLQACIAQTGLATTDVTLDRFVAHSPECDLGAFAWRNPPYEYEFDRLPIDVLAGNSWLRSAINEHVELSDIAARMEAECRSWQDTWTSNQQ